VFATSLSSLPDFFPASDAELSYADLELAGTTFRVLTFAVVKEPEDDEEDREEWLEDHPGEELPVVEPMSFRITVGRTTDEVDEAQGALRRRLLVGLGALFIVLVLMPAGVVSWALRPLKELSSQAQNVGPDTPDARLDEEGTDREVRSLAQALNRALGRLSAAYEQQRRFSADAAHELRTPLAAIRTNCEVALRTPRDATQLRKALKAVHRTVLRMGGILESLLTLGRFHDRDAVPMGSTELSKVAQEAVWMNASAARAKQLHLTLDGGNGVSVVGNEEFLVECVSNLVENAVRYTPSQGNVRVAIGNSGRPSITVEDTGIGIPEEHLPKIFDRFYRVDRARSRSQGGSGLGLAIAQEIARLHGGEIRVDSRAGEGSRFSLVLPQDDSTRAPS
jgi:heavy metal sensor kinase